MDLHIRLPKTLGCTVASTAVLSVLKDKYPKMRLVIYSDLPDLVRGLSFIDEIHSSKEFQKELSIDLFDYMKERDVLRTRPYRHLIDHMYEIAERVLGTDLLRKHDPHFNFDEREIHEAQDILKEINKGKPVVWLQKKTSKGEKDWSDESWREFEIANKDRYTFLELNEKYNRRLAVTLTKFCNAGVTLDTFLSHGSQAAGALNVIVILVSTRPEIVTYPNQHVLYKPDQEVTPEMVTEKLKELVS